MLEFHEEEETVLSKVLFSIQRKEVPRCERHRGRTKYQSQIQISIVKHQTFIWPRVSSLPGRPPSKRAWVIEREMESRLKEKIRYNEQRKESGHTITGLIKTGEDVGRETDEAHRSEEHTSDSSHL